ncbi:MAG: hypothetical protein MHM6MM_007006 [Cercozoa sp. M6MM]
MKWRSARALVLAAVALHVRAHADRPVYHWQSSQAERDLGFSDFSRFKNSVFAEETPIANDAFDNKLRQIFDHALQREDGREVLCVYMRALGCANFDMLAKEALVLSPDNRVRL